MKIPNDSHYYTEPDRVACGTCGAGWQDDLELAPCDHCGEECCPECSSLLAGVYVCDKCVEECFLGLMSCGRLPCP